MGLIFTEELRQKCLQFGACEDLPKVGLPIDHISQKCLFWAEDQNLLFDKVLEVPLWAFSKNGCGHGYDYYYYGIGYDDGQGCGYGQGYGFGCSEGNCFGIGYGSYGDSYVGGGVGYGCYADSGSEGGGVGCFYYEDDYGGVVDSINAGYYGVGYNYGGGDCLNLYQAD